MSLENTRENWVSEYINQAGIKCFKKTENFFFVYFVTYIDVGGTGVDCDRGQL